MSEQWQFIVRCKRNGTGTRKAQMMWMVHAEGGWYQARLAAIRGVGWASEAVQEAESKGHGRRCKNCSSLRHHCIPFRAYLSAVRVFNDLALVRG